MSAYRTAYEKPFPTRLSCPHKDCGSTKTTAVALKIKPEEGNTFGRWLCKNGHENRVEVQDQTLMHSVQMGINDVLRSLAGVELMGSRE